MKRGFIHLIAVLALAGTSAAAQVPDRDRAIRNYTAIQRGERQLGDLTPFEREEVMEVDRIVRAQEADRSTPAERCRREALRGRPGPPTDLERRLIELRCSQR